MTIAIRYTALACTFGMLFACTQPGADLRPDLAAAQPACAPGEKCTPPATTPSTVPNTPALKPAVPPVPDSPIKVNCAKLPTQVERDTCTNRKESTG
jgi:hypothetical protein